MAILNKPGAATPAPAPDDAALVAAATEYTLPSGRKIWWLPPDEMTMLAFTGALPDPITGAVYLLLEQEGAIKADQDDPASYHRKLNHLKAQLQIIKHGMVKPKFDPDLEVGTADVWGRRNLPRGDREFIYQWCFRLESTPEAIATAQRDQLRWMAELIPDSQGVRADASAADGDHGSDASVLHQSGSPASGGESSAG